MRTLIPILLILLLAGCNLPAPNADNDLIDQAATIVAMTLNAQSTPTSENQPLPSPTSAGTETPSPTITPTYAVPMLKFSEPTNCRSGPGQAFDLLFTLLPGASVEIVGRYPTNNYWIVKVDGMDDPCWVWGEYAAASGSHWAVPSVTPPPTATPQPAAQPTNLNYTFVCSFNGVNSDVSVTLNWNDQADDELGYRIFRDNALIVELPANSNTYSDQVAADTAQVIFYNVAAFNAAGESARAVISFSCQ